MSYPRDLDEYSENELLEEIERRRTVRERGLCDYCGRKPTTSPCKFPERHRGQPSESAQAVEEMDEKCPDCGAPVRAKTMNEGGGVTCTQCSWWFCY